MNTFTDLSDRLYTKFVKELLDNLYDEVSKESIKLKKYFIDLFKEEEYWLFRMTVLTKKILI